MASKGSANARTLWGDLLLKPAPAPAVGAISLTIILAGAVYCSGYEALTTGYDNWPGSLLWATYALLPFYLLIEAIKRIEFRTGRPMPMAAMAGLVLCIAAASLIAERVDYAFGGGGAPPVALSLLRRLPALAIVAGLIFLIRIARPSSGGRQGAPAMHDFADRGAIRWISAADNYLEVHYPGRTAMVRMTMESAQRRLERAGFVRIHRSIIVNRAHVSAIVPGDRGPEVLLEDGQRLPSGSAFSTNLRSLS